MIDIPASIAAQAHDSFRRSETTSVVVVLAGPIDNRIQRKILVSCEVTKLSEDYLEITCAD